MSAFGQQNEVLHKTPIGYLDSAVVSGADGSDIVPSWATQNISFLSTLVVGTPLSLDLVTILTDPGSPSSEIGMLPVSGQDPRAAGFSFSGTVLNNPCSFATRGSFYLTAVRNGFTALAGPINYVISAPAGVDNVAPTIPTGITAAPGATVGTIALTCDAPCDAAPGATPASGVTHVDILVNGVLSAPSPLVSPPNTLQTPTSTNIGSITSPVLPTVQQAAKAWTLSAAGTGITSTTSEQVLFVDFGTLTGAQKFIAKLDPYTCSGAVTALSGLMLHETAAAGGKFLFLGLRPSDGTVGLVVVDRTTSSGTSSQVSILTKDQNGASLIGPVYIKIERGADLATMKLSYSLNEDGWIPISTVTLAMTSAVHYGLALTSQTSTVQATTVIEEVAISNSALLQATITASQAVQIQLRAADVAGNTSALSTALTGVPKPPIAGNTKVFWNPGWYGAGNLTATAGPNNSGQPNDDPARFYADMDDSLKDPWVVGYRLAYKWHGLDAGIGAFTASVGGATSGTLSSITLGVGHPTSGPYYVAFTTSTTSPTPIAFRRCTLTNGASVTWSGALPNGTISACHFFNFALMDLIFARCATHYSLPKQLVLAIEVMSFSGGTRGNDKQIVPNYILNDHTTYGTSPDGAGGWWGPDPTEVGGSHTYSAATWRASVSAMYGLTFAALGSCYGTNPRFEGVIDQEPSAATQCALAGSEWGGPDSNDPTYDTNDANYVAQMKLYLATARAWMPNQNIMSENTFLNHATPTQQFEEWMMIGGSYIAPSAADVIGLIHILAANTPIASWGLQAYRGFTAAGSTWTGPDRSNIFRCLIDFESPDYGKFGATLQDDFNALQSSYKASHCFMTRLSTAQWAPVTAFLQANRLTNIDYPAAYPTN